MEQQSFHITKLKQAFAHKQRKNPSYSLRAFSRDVGMDSSSLGKVLRGERPLPKSKLNSILDFLCLSPLDKKRFQESVGFKKSLYDQIELAKEDQRYLLDESYFKIISQWEYYAVLELFEIKDFEIGAESIARKLHITDNRAEMILHDLISVGLIEERAGVLTKTHKDIKTTEDVTSAALKTSHVETLEMGLEKLQDIDLELRDFSSMTVAIDLEKLGEAKEVIREFRRKMSSLFASGDKTDVYNLAIQLYPLSHMNNKGEKQ